MLNPKYYIKALGLNLATNYALKNPKKNTLKLVKGIQRFASNSIQMGYLKAFSDENDPMYHFLQNTIENVNSKTLKCFVKNFGIRNFFNYLCFSLPFFVGSKISDKMN